MEFPNLVWHEIIGSAGVVMIVGCYFLIQVGWIESRDLIYSIGNLAGATLVMISLLYDFNLAAFALEAFWFLISGYGIAVWIRRKLE